jgi:hypothetical protein
LQPPENNLSENFSMEHALPKGAYTARNGIVSVLTKATTNAKMILHTSNLDIFSENRYTVTFTFPCYQ